MPIAHDGTSLGFLMPLQGAHKRFNNHKVLCITLCFGRATVKNNQSWVLFKKRQNVNDYKSFQAHLNVIDDNRKHKLMKMSSLRPFAKVLNDLHQHSKRSCQINRSIPMKLPPTCVRIESK
jgi:hypothetical protein